MINVFSTPCTVQGCGHTCSGKDTKCSYHLNKNQCTIPDCRNQAFAYFVCVKHGGKKQCSVEECKSLARGNEYCVPHGGFAAKRFCKMEGCTSQAHARKLCVRHGGGRQCTREGCAKLARLAGYCAKHAVETKICSVKNCSRYGLSEKVQCKAHLDRLVQSRKESIVPQVYPRRRVLEPTPLRDMLNFMTPKGPTVEDLLANTPPEYAPDSFLDKQMMQEFSNDMYQV